MGILDLFRSTFAALTSTRRCVWAGRERAHVQVRELAAGDVDAFVARLEDDLLDRAGVHWAQLYPQLGQVVVAFDPGVLPIEDLVVAVEDTERDVGLDARPFAGLGITHLGDVDRLVRETVALGCDLVGVGIGVSSRLVPWRGPVRAMLGSLASVVNGVPRVRDFLCSRFEGPGMDVGLSLVSSITQGLTVGPLAPFTDLVHHLFAFGETLSRQGAWLASEGELFVKPDLVPQPELAAPRPGPLPDGPVERFENQVWPVSLTAAGVVLCTVRDPRRAAAVMEAAIPKGARYGKEAFAAHLGWVLAARGVLVRDERVLRLLDRVDCLVVEESLVADSEEGAGDLFVTARRAGLEVVVAVPPDSEVPAGADRGIAAGDCLGEAVRGLQAEGRVVCLVGASPAGLAAADCAIGVADRDEPTPWGADLLCSDGLRQACFVVEATEEARAVSAFSARAAMAASAAGAALGLRRIPGGVLRTGTMINGAALVTMAEGARRALTLHYRPRPVPRDPTPWHAMEPEVVLERLGSSLDGLSHGEAGRRFPAPQRRPPAPVRLGRDMARDLATPLTPVLGTGAALSLATGAALDAVMVTAVVALNAAIGGFQQFSAAEAFSNLERRRELTATVRRAGNEARLDAGLVVPGDVVHLRAGDAVVADCRILESSWLEVDESSLTGESFPVSKDPAPVDTSTVAERRSMLYDGTFVAAGEALAVVVATGRATEARRAVEAGRDPPQTGVEARLRRLTDLTTPVALGGGVVTMAVGALRRQPLSRLAAGAVSLAVAAVPEGLPLLSGVAQFAAARRLADRGVLVRNQKAVEALGRVDVMCVDKTGTLTKGKQTLTLVAPAGAADEAPAQLSACGRLVMATALRATPEPAEGRILAHPADTAVTRGANASGGPR